MTGLDRVRCNAGLAQAVISTTSPGLIELNATSAEGISGTNSAYRLLAATNTITATPIARRFC
jgi:hypothetical protein